MGDGCDADARKGTRYAQSSARSKWWKASTPYLLGAVRLGQGPWLPCCLVKLGKGQVIGASSHMPHLLPTWPS